MIINKLFNCVVYTFKTKKILIITDKTICKINIPFIGKIKYTIENRKKETIRGERFNCVCIDECI